MDAERAEGIVLRTQPVTESSLLVTWYTREWGKLRTLAKGARRPKSPLRGRLDLCYRAELLFLWSRRGDLHLLHESYLEQAHVGLRQSLPQMVVASYLCELVDLATAVEDANAAIFELLAAVLAVLQQARNETVLNWFELRLAAAAGWERDWGREGPVGKVLQALSGLPLEAARRVQLSSTQASQAREILDRIWGVELGRLPRSRLLLRGKSGVDKVP